MPDGVADLTSSPADTRTVTRDVHVEDHPSCAFKTVAVEILEDHTTIAGDDEPIRNRRDQPLTPRVPDVVLDLRRNRRPRARLQAPT